MVDDAGNGTDAGRPVTVIGLGPMGSALATAFLENGHRTTVWNRTPSKADPLVAKGAERAPGLAEAVRASTLIVVCVIDYDAPFAQGVIDVASQATADLAQEVVKERYDDPDSTLTSNAAGMEHIIDAAQAHGIDTSVLVAAKEIAHRAIAAGYGSDSFARLVEVLGRR